MDNNQRNEFGISGNPEQQWYNRQQQYSQQVYNQQQQYQANQQLGYNQQPQYSQQEYYQQPPVYQHSPSNIPRDDSGKTLGILSIIFGLFIAPVGLILSIV